MNGIKFFRSNLSDILSPSFREESGPHSPNDFKIVETNVKKNSLFKIDVRLLTIIVTVNIIIVITSMVSTFYSFYFRKLDIPFEYSIYFVIDGFLVIFFMIYVASHTEKELNRGTPWWRFILYHLFLAFVVSAIMRAGLEIHYLLDTTNSLKDLTTKYLLDRYILQLSNNFLRYFVVLFIIYSFSYFKKIKEAENVQRNLENQLLGAKLDILISQVHPHFLFNSLNTIVSLIQTNKEKATTMVVDLSEFLRQTLKLKEIQLITVSEELNILKKYLNILKLRFDDKVIVRQNIQMQVLDKKIPPLILQPVIENSIKHGFFSDLDSLSINLQMSIEEDGFLDVEIFNDGQPLCGSDKLFEKGIGLKNISNRLKGLYGEEVQFGIENLSSEKGVRTFFRIPLRE